MKKNNKWTGLIVFLALTGFLGSVQAASLQSLGELPGGLDYSFASGISADGDTVVGWSESANGKEAFIWQSDTGMQSLANLPGGSESFAMGVSGDGSIVVGYSHGLNGYEAVLWNRRSGELVSLGDLPGGTTLSIARAVSPDGITVVGDSDGLNGKEAFVWTSNGGMQGLGTLPGNRGLGSSAWGVNTNGSTIVGYADDGSKLVAVIWDSSYSLQTLGVNTTVARGISADAGTVIGYGDGLNGTEAFRWTSINGVTEGLGYLPGGSNSRAVAVSADGSAIVGYSNNSPEAAFIWQKSTGIRSLSDALAAQGVDLEGWTLNTATGISADGLTIVGNGTDPDGHSTAWLAKLDADLPLLIAVPALPRWTIVLMGLLIIALVMTNHQKHLTPSD